MIFSPRPSRITVVITRAFATVGEPTSVLSSVETSSTRSSATSLPGSAGNSSTSTVWPGVTRYCLPPVSITAYMVWVSPAFLRYPSIIRLGLTDAFPASAPHSMNEEDHMRGAQWYPGAVLFLRDHAREGVLAYSL